MAGEFGVSFSPTGNDDQQKASGASQTPLQDAIKVLSLRIPQFHGGMAPQGLLNGPGSAGVPGVGGAMPGGLDEFLRRLFGQMGGGQMGGGMPGGPSSAPAPHVVPGEEQRMAPQAPTPELPGGVVKPGGISPSGAPRPSMFGPKPPMIPNA